MVASVPIDFPASLKIARESMTAIDFNVTEAQSQRGDYFTDLSPGSRWGGEFSLAPIVAGSQAEDDYRTFMAKLRSVNGAFKVPVSFRKPIINDGVIYYTGPTQDAGGTTISVAKKTGFSNADAINTTIPLDQKFITIDDNMYELHSPRNPTIDDVTQYVLNHPTIADSVKTYTISPSLQKEVTYITNNNIGVSWKILDTLNMTGQVYCVAKAITIVEPRLDPSGVYTGASIVWRQDIR